MTTSIVKKCKGGEVVGNKSNEALDSIIEECHDCAVDYETGEVDETIVSLERSLRAVSILTRLLELI